jgi:hypothetical protein
MSSTSVTERVQVSGSSWNPKVACAVALLLVFDFGVHRTRIPSFETPAGKALYFERMQRELNLTPQQSEQMQSVLNDFWQYYRTVLSDGKQRVEALLNDEQRAKFEKMLQQQLPR